MKPNIATERTLLRPFVMDDVDDLFAYASSDKVGPMAGWPPHKTLEDSIGVLKMFIEEDEVWAIVLKETGKVIGSVGLHKRARKGIDFDYELGYALSEDYWGQGIMPECCRAVLNYAFTKTYAQVIICGHFTFNTQSKRVIEKLEFKYLTHLDESWNRYDGVALDEEIYVIEKRDFLGKKLGYIV